MPFPESEIERLIKEVIHSAVIEEKNLRSTIKTMVARNDRTIEFHLADGTSMTKAWIPSSRKHSWTEEMKERARKIKSKQNTKKEEEYEENHSHSVND